MNKKIGVFLVVLCTFFTSPGEYFLKKALENIVLDLSIFHNYTLFLGLSLYVLGAFILLIALKFGPLSTLYPILSLNYVWVATISVNILGEQISPLQYLGLGFIIIGVILIAGGKK